MLHGCESSTDTSNIYSTISYITDKNEYTLKDSVKVIVENRVESQISFGLRCNIHLEMDFQKKEGANWSGNKEFWFSSFKCPTFLYNLKKGNEFSYKIESKAFGDVGIYRLVLNYNVADENNAKTIYSNQFEIK